MKSARKTVFKFVCIVELMLWTVGAHSQDFTFDQFYPNRVRFNPAYAGSEYFQHLSAVTRYQYPGLGDPYITNGVSFDTYIEPIRSGFAVMATRDAQGGGIFSRNYLDLAYAYKLKVSKEIVIRPSLQVGFGYYQTNPSGIRFPDMYDNGGNLANVESYASQSKMLYDFSGGILFSYRTFYAGLAVHHILEPVEYSTPVGDFKILRKITLHAGYAIPLESGIRYRYQKKVGHSRIGRVEAYPTVVLELQNGQTRAQMGGLIVLESAFVGTFVKNTFPGSDFRIAFLFGYYTKSINFGYSFDLGSLNGKVFGFNTTIHEVTLTMKIKYKKLKRKYWWERKAIFGPEY